MTTEHNRIVDAAAGKVSVLEGAGLVQDVAELSASVASGQWAGGFVSLLSSGLEVRDTLQDPMAKFISMGLGWAIEFFGPLNAWLDWLTVDQEQLTVAAETWSGISAELRTAAAELDGYYKTDAAHWSGAAVDQYRLFCADRVNLYNAAAGAAAVTANLISHNKILLTIVRSLVRDMITDSVGKVISIILRYPPPATPAASGEIVAQVQSTGNAVLDLMRKLQHALGNARRLLKQSGNIFGHVKDIYREADDVMASFVKPLSARAQTIYHDFVDEQLDKVAKAAMDGVKTAGKDVVDGLPEQVGMEILKEPTKYGAGRVDQSAPTHPDIERVRHSTGDGE
jgi:hypothetical protein